ncbi:uncharacterized protein LOC112692301 [Sipha flava]|uniref:Uncharacterized protein LOC112692301 n=1 Tax=Sipha flava TaxID=143950 RepID=A0A8B8GHL4_9HEMI|nr:uncharacterized protein LOC112692301 [Sipha flava]
MGLTRNGNKIKYMKSVPFKIKAIRENRTESLKNLKVQTIKMKQASENRFCPGEVGQSVTVKIPDVDSDFRNIIGVILSVNNNMYEIGTKEGRFSTLYNRNQFVICKERFLEVDDTKISLRGAARKSSNLGGQSYDRCTCIQKCKTRKCKCKAAERLCSSKCHGSSTCDNK